MAFLSIKTLVGIFIGFHSISWALSRSVSSRITGGSDVNVTEVPYMAAVEFMGRFSCAGVIISPRWIATSGACMDLLYPEDIVVRTGATEYETGGHLYPVQKIVNHPLNQGASSEYDLALVQLALDIVMNTNTRAIPITTTEPAAGTIAKVSGWGSTVDGSIMHRALKAAQLPIYARQQCNERYSFDVTVHWICTLQEGTGPCSYDDGDPLVVGGNLVGTKVWILQEQCGDPNLPSPYMNFANPDIRGFIRNTTGV